MCCVGEMWGIRITFNSASLLHNLVQAFLAVLWLLILYRKRCLFWMVCSPFFSHLGTPGGILVGRNSSFSFEFMGGGWCISGNCCWTEGRGMSFIN